MSQLPENIDTTYPDSTADPSVELHQAHHDELHRQHNLLDAGTFPASSVAFTPVGTVASTNVQAAIAEVAAEAGTGGAWGSISGTLSAQTDLQAALDAKQATDADLTTLAGLAATTNNFIVSVASAWASRTPAQVKTTLSLDNVDNTSDATKNAAAVTLTNKTLTSPVVNTPTGIVKGDVGLGNVDNTADASKAFAGSQITSGTVPIARIPTGTTSATVPLGGVITGAGPTGDASHTLALTYNAAGQLTAVTNNAIAIAESAVTNLVSDLALKAPLASPTFTGTVTVPTPSGATDASTKAYVDAAISGVASEPECKYGTTAALPTVVYNNGSSGVGATLVAVGLGALSLDGNTPAVNDSVLIKNQVAQEQNGIYTVTTVGNAGVAFVLTRRTNFDQASEIAGGDVVFVQAGTTNGNTTWTLSVSGAVVVGTTALPWVQTGGPGSVTAGTGISVTGNQVSIDTATTVDKTTAQTLTNKTLTAPVLSSPTGLAAADIPALAASKITSGQLIVAQGGTGAATLTAHGVLVGEGTSAVAVTSAGTSGQVLTSGGASADPSFQNLDVSQLANGSIVTILARNFLK